MDFGLEESAHREDSECSRTLVWFGEQLVNLMLT